MKRLLGIILAVMTLGYVVYGVNPDSFEVSVTPLLTYSVEISTPAGGLDFGSVNLNTVQVLSTSATIRNNGNVQADWTVRAVALNTWTLGTTLSDNGLNKVVLAAKLNSTLPNSGVYTDNDVLTATEKDANTTNFAGDQNGNNVTANSSRLMWIYLRTPTDTTVDTQQRFRIEVRAYPANKF